MRPSAPLFLVMTLMLLTPSCITRIPGVDGTGIVQVVYVRNNNIPWQYGGFVRLEWRALAFESGALVEQAAVIGAGSLVPEPRYQFVDITLDAGVWAFYLRVTAVANEVDIDGTFVTDGFCRQEILIGNTIVLTFEQQGVDGSPSSSICIPDMGGLDPPQ